MSTTEQRLAANRSNALLSTGPTTAEGRAVASRNATTHGLLSSRLFLEDEDPVEFNDLLDRLSRSLRPVDAVEETLVERIAITVWRQRRLVTAETARLTLERLPLKVARGLSEQLGRSYGSKITADELVLFDKEQEGWCQAVVAELEPLQGVELATMETRAPQAYAQLAGDAGEDEKTPAAFIAGYEGGLAAYLAELLQWCREQLRQADERPMVLALAEQVRAKRMVLPAETLEVLTRYQTTLDNQLIKLLKALRQAQEWRLRTVEGSTDVMRLGDGGADAA